MAEELNPQDVQRYRIAWHSYVTRRNLMIVLFVGFVPDHGRGGGVDVQLRLAARAGHGYEGRFRHPELW